MVSVTSQTHNRASGAGGGALAAVTAAAHMLAHQRHALLQASPHASMHSMGAASNVGAASVGAGSTGLGMSAASGSAAASSPMQSVFGAMTSPSPSLLSGHMPAAAEAAAEAAGLRSEVERLSILVSVKDEQMKTLLTDFHQMAATVDKPGARAVNEVGAGAAEGGEAAAAADGDGSDSEAAQAAATAAEQDDARKQGLRVAQRAQRAQDAKEIESARASEARAVQLAQEHSAEIEVSAVTVPSFLARF